MITNEEKDLIRQVTSDEALRNAMVIYCDIYGINAMLQVLSVAVEEFGDLSEDESTADKLFDLSGTLHALSKKETYDVK
jgi:hypothetical protein